MIPFVLCMLLNAHPDFWLSPNDFDKKYCQQRAGRVEALRNELSMTYGAIAKDPNLANDERIIAVTQSMFVRMQREIKELEDERAERRVRLLLSSPKAPNSLRRAPAAHDRANDTQLFPLSFLLAAHPDFWLPESEFDKKYCAYLAHAVKSLRQDLDKQHQTIAKEKDAEHRRRLVRYTAAAEKEQKYLEERLDNLRRDKRIALLLRLPHADKRE